MKRGGVRTLRYSGVDLTHPNPYQPNYSQFPLSPS